MAMLRGLAPEPPSNWGERLRGHGADKKKRVYDFSLIVSELHGAPVPGLCLCWLERLGCRGDRLIWSGAAAVMRASYFS